METAGGSAEREMNIIRESISYNINAIKEEWTQTLQEMIQKEDVVNLLKGALKVSESLGDVLSAFAPSLSDILDVIATVGSDLGEILEDDLVPIVKLAGDLIHIITGIGSALSGIIPGLNSVHLIIGATYGKKAVTDIANFFDVLIHKTDESGNRVRKSFKEILNSMANFSKNKKFDNVLSNLGFGEGILKDKNFQAKTLEFLQMGDAINDVNKNMEGMEGLAFNCAQQLNAAGVSSKVASKGFAAVNAGSRAAAVGMGILKGAIFGVIGVLASLAITKGIEALSKAIDNLVHKEENITKAGKEAAESIKSIVDETKKLENSTNSIKNRYAELAQGVDKLGTAWQSQGSLSTDEYNEFLDLSNQLAELYPSLTKGYDENGTAILNLNGDVETITGSLNDLLEAEKKLSNQQIAKGAEDVITAYKQNYKGTLNDIAEIQKSGIDDYSNALNAMMHGGIVADNNVQNAIKLGLSQINKDYQDFRSNKNVSSRDSSSIAGGGVDFAFEFDEDFFKNLSEEDQKILKDYYAEIINANEKEIGILEDKLENQNSELKQSFIALLETDTSLSDETRKVAEEIVSGLDISDYAKKTGKDFGYDQFKKDFIQTFDDISNKDLKDNIVKLLSGSFENSLEEFDLNNLILSQLRDQPGFDPDNPSEFYIYLKTNAEDTAKEAREILKHVYANANERSKSFIMANYTDDVLALTDAEREALLNLEIPDGVIYSWDELMEKISGVSNALKEIPNEANITDSVNTINEKVKPQIDALTSVYSEMLDENGKVLDPKNFSNDQMKSIADSLQSNAELGIEFDTENVEEFFEILADGEATAEETQEAFDKLATTWMKSSEYVEKLNMANREAVAQQLEQLGITNSEEMVTAELIAKQIDLANATYENAKAQADSIDDVEERTKATREANVALTKEIEALFEEEGALYSATDAEKAYALAKYMESFDFVSGDLSQLNAIVQALGVGVDAWEEYYAAKIRMEKEIANPTYTNAQAETEYLKTFQNETKSNLEDFQSTIEEIQGQYHIGAPPSSSKSGSSSSSKEEKDPVIEQYEKEYDVLKWLLDNGYIDQKEYYDQLRILYEKFFKDKDKYAKEYAEKEREYLEGLKSMYEGSLSSIISLFDKEVDKINKAKDKKLKALEEEQKKQKEALQAQIDAAENNIKNKQKEIDALQEANEERKRELDLQKALYDQQRAMNQRTILQYNEDKGYHYVADTDAIKEANEKVEDVRYEQQVAALEKELDLLNDIKDALDKQMDDLEESFEKQKKELEDYYNALIKPFEDTKTKWQELKDAIEMAEVINSLKELGYNVDDILSDKEGVFERFKGHLLGVYGDLSAGNEVLRASFLEAFNTDDLGSYLSASQNMMGQLNALDLTDYKTGIETSSQDALAFRDRIAELIDKISQINNLPLTLNVDDSRLKELEAGGGVNLEVRPIIDANELLKAGWEDVGEGAATLFSSTFSNAAGNIAVNFTPVIADPTTGQYKGVLSPQELEDYAMEVINGVHPDYLNLQIGAQFTGDDAVSLADAAAEEINNIHGQYTDNMLGISDETRDTITESTEFIVSQSEVATSTIQGNIDSLHGKDITITIHTKHVDDGKGGLGSNAARLGGTAYASGKWQAGKDETALLAEEGAEIIAHRDGTYEIVGKNGAEFRNVKHDDVVFDAEQTKKLLEHGRINSRGKAYANGKDNYVPLSIADPDKFKMLNAFTSFVDVVQPEIVKMSDNIEALVRKVVTSPMSSTSNNAQNINLNIGDIHLTGVQDVNGLSQAIVQRLPNQILQEINKR